MVTNYSSKFGAFLDSYNQNNIYLQNAADSFMSRIQIDSEYLVEHGNTLLKQKAINLTSLIKDKSRNSYERLLNIGSLLDDMAKDIVTAKNEEVKRSGSNLIKSFFEVAKQTEDNQLLNTALQIAKEIPVKS